MEGASDPITLALALRRGPATILVRGCNPAAHRYRGHAYPSATCRSSDGAEIRAEHLARTEITTDGALRSSAFVPLQHRQFDVFREHGQMIG